MRAFFSKRLQEEFKRLKSFKKSSKLIIQQREKYFQSCAFIKFHDMMSTLCPKIFSKLTVKPILILHFLFHLTINSDINIIGFLWPPVNGSSIMHNVIAKGFYRYHKFKLVVINANSKITFDETEPDIYNQQTSKIPQNKLAESWLFKLLKTM